MKSETIIACSWIGCCNVIAVISIKITAKVTIFRIYIMINATSSVAQFFCTYIVARTFAILVLEKEPYT